MKNWFLVVICLFILIPLYAEDNIPVAQKDLSVKYPLNSKGDKYAEFIIIDVNHDSSELYCHSFYTIDVYAVGIDVHLNSHGKNNSIDGIKISDVHDLEFTDIAYKGMGGRISFDIWSTPEKSGENVLYYEGKPLFSFPIHYDNSAYCVQKLKKNAPNTPSQPQPANDYDPVKAHQLARARQDTLLTPSYLANWVGYGNFTKENIENDLDIRPVAYNGGKVMYSFSRCGVTMEFSGSTNVCTELSFRLYGEDGYNMKKSLLDYGYTLVNEDKQLIAENNFEDLGYGKRSVYRCKLKNGDSSVCEILEGQAFMFTFYRTK